MKILIADDDKTIHISFTKMLTAKGFEVLHAYDGKDALRQAQEHLPEIVLLDLTMPELDGREVCKALKGKSETSHLKVIMLTAKDQQHDRKLGFELGADEFISKPSSVMYLERTINKILRKTGTSETISN